MDKKTLNNLKIIYGVDLIVFGVVLGLHLMIDKFNFNSFWCLFLVIPSMVEIILNKLNVFNGSMFVLSSAILGYFVFNNVWASLIVFAILIGIILIFGKYLAKKKE